MSNTPIPIAVIGAGPAGLMAAEVLSVAGLCVHVYDAMPSVGRKFLLAIRNKAKELGIDTNDLVGHQYFSATLNRLLCLNAKSVSRSLRSV